jgi:hypothetical protein
MSTARGWCSTPDRLQAAKGPEHSLYSGPFFIHNDSIRAAARHGIEEQA